MTRKAEVIGGVEVQFIKKENLKNVYLRVNPPEGDVTVSAPINYPDDELRLFILKKLPEIHLIRAKMQSQERQSKREYISGESHYLWGKPYRLDVEATGTSYEIMKLPNRILFKVPEGATRENKEKHFNEWYRTELKRVLDSMIHRIETKMDLYADEYKIKNMKTKWGTCNIEKRRIWINLQLSKKPMECLEYVLVHEMVHLLERNHTHRFFALVEEYYPSWKEAKKRLEGMPLDYMEKGENRGDEE